MNVKINKDRQNNADYLRQIFKQDGFIAIRGFLDAQEVAEVHENLKRFIAEVLPTLPKEQVYYEDLQRPDTLKQIQQMYTYDAYFADLFYGQFRDLAALLLEDKAVGKNMQYFNKPPQIGKPTPPHQDGYYFMITPCQATTMWLALDVVDEENGCVRYVRGSKERGMRPHGRTQTLGFSQGITDYGSDIDQAHEVILPAKPGDLLVHHAMTIHRADGNRSQNRHRRALGFIYYAENVQEDREAHAAYQKKLAQELAQEGKI